MFPALRSLSIHRCVGVAVPLELPRQLDAAELLLLLTSLPSLPPCSSERRGLTRAYPACPAPRSWEEMEQRLDGWPAGSYFDDRDGREQPDVEEAGVVVGAGPTLTGREAFLAFLRETQQAAVSIEGSAATIVGEEKE